MILVDPPAWPAHGTIFSHLVSDSSLDELHAFATRIDLSFKAFDHDHYDLPLRLYEASIAAGAEPVSGAELVRRLVASGLRVRTPDRAPRRTRVSDVLRRSWTSTLPGQEALGEDLLRRWSEPHRHYHDVRHLHFMLDRLDELGVAERPVRLAAWFHDAVYEGRAGTDEENSALLAESELAGVVPSPEIAEVARLVRLTAAHDPEPSDAAGAALSDADLAILATRPGRYDTYVRDVRADYEHVPDELWRIGRRAVLDQLLALAPLYATAYGQEHWAAQARTNLLRERDRWA